MTTRVRGLGPLQPRWLDVAVGALLAILLLAAGTSGATSEAPQLARVVRSDEDLLILSLALGAHPLSDGILAFSDERGILLPLGQLIDALALPMAIDVEGGRVEGWVVDPMRAFALDFSTRTVTLDGAAQPLVTDALIEAHVDELYVGAELLASWWSVDIEIDPGRLRAVLASTSSLPIARRLDRRAAWEQLTLRGAGPRIRELGLPALHEPYQLLDWPAIDSTLDVAWRRSSEGTSTQQARYSALAQGDLLRMTASLFLSGTHENGSHRFASRRLSLSQTDQESGLLGALGATEFRVGDQLGLAHPVVTHGRGGRGFGFERVRDRGGSHFDDTILRGDVLPGWDVELYRGDQLLDFQTAGADGRYEFRDIPLVIGLNNLRVLMFGPHGEQREDVERIVVGAGALPPGEVRYRASVVEQGRGLLGAGGDPGELAAGGIAASGQGELVLGGTFAYGLTRRWTGNAGALSLPIDTGGGIQRRSYAWLGLEGSVLGTTNLLEVVGDVSGGWAGRVAAQRRVGALGLRLEHRQFFAFLSDLNRESELAGTTELRVDGRIPLRGRRRLPFSFSSTWEQQETGSSFRARGELSYLARLGSIRLANRWGVDAERDQVTARGRATLHGRFGRLPVRGRLTYEVWPQTELTSLDVNVAWERRENIMATFGLAHDLGTSVGRARVGLNWQARQHVFSMSLDAGSDGSLSLQVGTRFSLRRDARARRYHMRTDASAGQGVAEAFVFLDDNGNGAFDEGDEPLPNIAFELDGGRHPVTTDDHGVAHLAIGAHRRTSLSVAGGSLEDPYWLSTRPGVEVLTRPGRTESIAFPIVATGEIEGTVYLVRGAGKREVGGVQLDLVDPEGHIVSSVESQYDGFYLFEKVLPGRYRLRIAPEDVDRWGLERLEPVDLTIGVGVIHGGVDFHIEISEATSGATLGS